MENMIDYIYLMTMKKMEIKDMHFLTLLILYIFYIFMKNLTVKNGYILKVLKSTS